MRNGSLDNVDKSKTPCLGKVNLSIVAICRTKSSATLRDNIASVKVRSAASGSAIVAVISSRAINASLRFSLSCFENKSFLF